MGALQAGERVPSGYGGPRILLWRVSHLSLIPTGTEVVAAETRKSVKSVG